MPQIIEISEEQAMAPVLRLAGQDFRDSGAGEWLGFYDRILDRKGEMIGIQQWIDEFSHLQFFKNFLGMEINLVQQVVRIFSAMRARWTKRVRRARTLGATDYSSMESQSR